MLFRKKNYFIALTICVFIFCHSSCFAQQYHPANVGFSRESGAYPEYSFEITITAPEEYSIYYTTDGAIPTAESKKYDTPITITAHSDFGTLENLAKMGIPGFTAVYDPKGLSDAAVIRAIAVAPDGTASDVATRTYFPGTSIAEKYKNIAVFSIVTDPNNLIDYETGIYTPGKYYDEWAASEEGIKVLQKRESWKIQGNFSQKGREWERPASIELFDGTDTLTIRQEGGIRIKGGASRPNAQKSFNVYFRKDYGEKRLNYPLFPDAANEITGETISSYKGFTLRNGGNDSEYLKFKDGWTQSLLLGLSFSTQQDRPAILYLNGEYWGVYNLMDKLSDNYVEDHYGVKNALVIKEGELEDGDAEDYYLYEELLAFSDKDMSLQENYDAFLKIMDIQSMADYFAAEIYIGNTDWWENQNTALWRSVIIDENNPYMDGRWRYMMYDTEYSASHYSQAETKYSYNSIQRALDKQTLFASLMRNENFRGLFSESIENIAKNNLSYEKVNTSLYKWASDWRPYMLDYYRRFGNSSWSLDINMEGILNFYAIRPTYIKLYLERACAEITTEK